MTIPTTATTLGELREQREVTKTIVLFLVLLTKNELSILYKIAILILYKIAILDPLHLR